MKIKNSLVIVAGLLVMFLIGSCKKQESPAPVGNGPPNTNPTVPPNPYTPPAVTFNAPVMGFVLDESGNAVQNAVVSTGNQTFTTDANGAFEFTSAPFTGNFCYIKVVKSGYFFGSTTVQGTSSGSYTAQLVMLKQDNVQSFDAAAGKEVTVAGGAVVNFPTGAIKKLDGTPYTGNVSVATKYLSPEASNFNNITPGGDLRAYNKDGKDVMLYSYGMVGVELRDGAGNLLQLADGKKAEITMPVPASMSGSAPATIPLWYFDENKGVWIEDGEAKLQNGKYVGSVAHFTYWNCDHPGNRAKLKGKVKDCDGDAISNFTIKTGQTNAWIDQDGNWERYVPAGIEFKLSAFDQVSGNDLNLNISVPVLANEQELDMGTITLPCRQKVKGTITDCNNNPFTGYAIIKTASKTYRGTVTNGRLGVTVFSNGEPAELYIHNATVGQLFKVNITLPASGKSLDVGLVKACPPKTVTTEFSFSYDDGTGVQSVSFTNFTNASGTYNTQTKYMSFRLQTSLQEYASFNLLNPKVGPNIPSFDSLFIATQGRTFQGAQNLTFDIAKYETPGDEVSGTFSGTMEMLPQKKSVTITNGKFRVLRMPDEQ